MNDFDSDVEEETVNEPSPSTSNYCYSLECALRIESTSSGIRKATVQSKKGIVTVGRNAERKIVLQVEICESTRGRQAHISYALQDCRVHEKAISQGRGGIEIPSKNLTIFMTNCAPRKLNVFLKTLHAKIELMNAERNGVNTPIAVKRERMLNGCLPEVFTKLSPLTVGEIRKVRRLRGVVDSPLSRPSNSNTPQRGVRQQQQIQQTPTTSRKSPRIARRNSGGATPKRTGNLMPRLAPAIIPIQLSDEQRAILRAVVSGRQSVFFTGNAGTGKSLVLQRIIEMLPADTTVITAATGVAACQLGGMTLHSFGGFGVGGIPKEDCLRIAEGKKQVVQNWKKLTHLVIDEISMVDAQYFTCLEYVARKIRDQEKPSPFGGIQLVITGDFLQLPPVSKDKEPMFCFESPAWNASISTTILLKQVRRQNDIQFIRLLQEIRVGNCPPWILSTLQATRTNRFAQSVIATRLCTHSADAEQVNKHNLRELRGTEKTFMAEDSEPVNENAAGLIPKCLILKVNAQVMLTKNLDLSRGLSNGARGVVTDFSPSGYPLVKFLANKEEPVELRPMRFQLKGGSSDHSVFRRQLPLQLAWAISIHKSQGLTLDAVEMDLQKIFAEGQTYVALSRARSLDALKVSGFHANCVRANKKVVKYYETLNENLDEDAENYPPISLPKRTRLSF
ncbi:unnamed protein product, partial [Mesorhabditis belari]|uniref:ATP-dependent DNA helicase n=1 Tax=Mesorhabditis belari TaxID=2138241 RepID=A0AAF3F1W3_9BILA